MTTQQQTLFGAKRWPDPCRNRHGGNENSQAAHGHVQKEDRYKEILSRLEAAGKTGLTLDELSDQMGVAPNRISGRLTELRVDKRIERTTFKRTTRTGSNASVYRSLT